MIACKTRIVIGLWRGNITHTHTHTHAHTVGTRDLPSLAYSFDFHKQQRSNRYSMPVFAQTHTPGVLKNKLEMSFVLCISSYML